MLDDAARSPVVLEHNGRRFIVTANEAPAHVTSGDDEDMPADIAAWWRRAEGATPDATEWNATVNPTIRREPGAPPPAPDRETTLAALEAAAGSWADLDVDTIIRDIYEARIRGSRDFPRD